MNPVEQKILKKLSMTHLITKEELKKFLKDNGENFSSHVMKNLIANKYVNEIHPIGSTCFVITQKGMKILKEFE